jgi:hypothetical protein
VALRELLLTILSLRVFQYGLSVVEFGDDLLLGLQGSNGVDEFSFGVFQEYVAALKGGLKAGIFEALFELTAVFLFAGEQCVGDRSEAVTEAFDALSIEEYTVVRMEHAEGAGASVEFALKGCGGVFSGLSEAVLGVVELHEKDL